MYDSYEYGRDEALSFPGCYEQSAKVHGAMVPVNNSIT